MPNSIRVPITQPRVPFLNPETGFVSMPWYLFLLSLSQLTGGSEVSLGDLQKGPPTLTIDEITAILNKAADSVDPSQDGLLAQIAELQKQIEALDVQVKPELGTMAALQQANLPWVTFDNTPQSIPTNVPGTLYWDEADGNQTLNLVMAGGVTTQQIGEEQYYRIKADSTITEGQVVMFTGTVGASGALKGAPATGLTASTALYVMGVATENIAANKWGYVTSFGLVRGINTTGGAETWVDGQILYLNPAVAGGLTKTVPVAPNPKVVVAAVVHAATNGSLFIRPAFGGKLGDFEGDVNISSPVNGDLLIYDAVQGRWENATLTAGTNVSIVNGAGAVTINATDAFTGTVTSVAALTLGTTGTDLSSTVANPTTTPVITLNVPTASSSNRGALSSADWSTFNSKQAALVSGTNIKTVGGVTLLGAGDVSAPSFTTVTTSSTTDATTPNSGTTGGFRLRGNATSATAYLQVTDSTASAQWGYASIVASGLWTWSGAFTATTITASTQFSGAGTGLTGTASGLSVGGNAATATALQTARTIGGVSFNGTANISLPGVDTTGNQNTSGNAATATNVAGSGITGSRNIPAAALPAGTVLQVVNATYSTQVSTASSTYADTGLTATITPTSNTSKILVIVSQSNVAKDSSDTGANIRLLRGASALTTAAIIAAYNNNSTPNNVGSVSLNYLDSPATTSATTYKTQVASNMGSGTCYVQTNGSTSYITLMEIAA